MDSYMLEMKIFLVVISGALGVFGVLGKFVHNGQLTPSGRASLILLILSVCCGVIVQLYEYDSDSEKTRLNALMFDSIKKAILPLQPDWSHIFICMNGVENEISLIAKEYDWDQGEIKNSRMSFDKSKFPQKLALESGYVYGFSKEKIPENSSTDAYYNRYDYKVETVLQPISSYIIEKGRQICHVSYTRPSDMVFSRKSSSRLLSVPDLLGSYMYIRVSHSRKSITNFHLQWLDFELYPGLRFQLRNSKDQFRAVFMDKSISVYEYQFPKSEKEFWSLFSSYN